MDAADNGEVPEVLRQLDCFLQSLRPDVGEDSVELLHLLIGEPLAAVGQTVENVQVLVLLEPLVEQVADLIAGIVAVHDRGIFEWHRSRLAAGASG